MLESIDQVDREILRLLQENARIPNAEIARRVGLAPTAIFQRIRKLEDGGVIRGYTAQIDPEALGLPLTAFVQVRTGEAARAQQITPALVELPEVQEVHRVVGEDCYMVKVRARSPEDLAHLLDERLQTIPGVASTRTTIVLTTAKETQSLAPELLTLRPPRPERVAG